MGDEKRKSNTNEDSEGGIPKPFPSLDGKVGHIAAKKVYALLIGIDHYDFFVETPGDQNLKGCVRDSIEVERYLKETVENPAERLHLRKLRSHLNGPDPAVLDIEVDCAVDEEHTATRQDMLSAMTEFLTQAEEGDIVFIHYSGHGSTERRPEQLAHIDLNADGRSETIICSDSYVIREEDGKRIGPLRDLEVRWLLRRIAAKNPHIVFITDCCNSSGNSRILGESITVRNTDTPENEDGRLIEDFVFYQEEESARELLDGETPEQFQLPQGRHVAIAACQKFELAKEKNFPEGRYGVLTYHLLKILRSTKANISYRDLTKLIRAKASADVKHQAPQSFAKFTPDLDLKFMGGTTTADEPYYLVRPGDNDKECIVDAGSLHGIYPVDEGKTWAALYPSNVNISDAKPEESLRAFFKEVRPHESILQLEEEASFPEGAEFMKAIITASPVPKTKVCLLTELDEALITIQGEPTTEEEKQLQAGVELLLDAIEGSRFLEVVERPEDSQYSLFTYKFEGQYKYRISEKDGFEALVAPKEGLHLLNARDLIDEMGHIARWERTLKLEKKQYTLIQPGDIDIVVLDTDGEEIRAKDGVVTLIQKRAEDGSWVYPRVKFKVVLNNRQQVPLFCALAHLPPDFGIIPDLLPLDSLLGKKEFVDTGREIDWKNWEVYAGSQHVEVNPDFEKGAPFKMKVPDSYVDRGILEVEDHFKLIASTEQFDPLNLSQISLPEAIDSRDFGSSTAAEADGEDSELDLLFKEVNSRQGGFDFEGLPPRKPIKDWYTTKVVIKTKVVLDEE